MKKIISSIIFILIFSINAFAKVSNPTFNSNEGNVDLIYSSSTTTYNFNLLKSNNNLSIKISDENANIVLMDVASGEIIGATNFDEPFNELNIDNLASGEYSILFSGSGDFSIFTNGIDLKDILSLQISVENYEFKLDKTYSDIVISEANENAFINLSSTTSNNTFYQNINEPFNTLKIASLESGIYQLNITINSTASTTNEIVDEPTIISADETTKVSNPIVKSNSGEIKLTYTGYNKEYLFTLVTPQKDIIFKKSTNDCGLIISSNTKIIVDGCKNNIEGEVKIDNLEAGEYKISVFNGDLETITSSTNENLMDKLQLLSQSDHYEFISKNDLNNVYIENDFKDSTITLFSIEDSNVNFQSEESFLSIDKLFSGRYQVNVNRDFIITPSVDESQKFSNPILTSKNKTIDLTYINFTREYTLTLKEAQTNLTISKKSDCGILVKKREDEKFKDICENSATNSFKVDKLSVGEYDIHIVGNEEFKIYSDSGSLKDNLKLTGKSDSYEFKLDSISTDIILKDLNESLEVSIDAEFITYANSKAPYNILSVSGLRAGDYKINIHTSINSNNNTQTQTDEISEIDEKYKFSNPKIFAGEDELKLNYVNFERDYQFNPTKDYENILITKDGDGCGVMVKNISNGGEIIDSCNNEIQNILNIDLLKKGDYTISIIGSENFSITSNGENIKDKLKFNGKSDNYTLALDSIKRDIIIKDANESSIIEIFDTKNMDFKYVKSEYPFNYISIPFLKAGTYGVNINAFIKADTSISKPTTAEVIEYDNKTEITTKPIELISGFNSKIQTIIDDKGRVEATIGIRDKDDNLIKQTIFKAPKGGEVEMDESGNLKHTLITTITKAEITAKSSGEVEAKISINDTDNLKREFIVPAGSQTEVKDDGTTTAMNELEGDKGSYETNVEVKPDGEVSATAFLYENSNQRTTKLSTGLLTASYTARRDFSSVKVEFIWNEVNSSRKLRATKIDSGLLKATYTTRRSFSFEGETLNSRSIDVSNMTNITITPSPEATFEENQEFLGENEGYRTIELIDGEANITIDGQTSIMSSEIYILPKVDGKELYLSEGWNLISIPINIDISSDITSEDVNYTLDSFGSYVEFWKIDNNNSWEKNPDLIKSGEGFWIYLNAQSYSLFSGSGYDINFSNLYDGWHLFGAGKDLENLKENYNFNQVYKFSRENNDSSWIKDPTVIYRGEGFWVESEYKPYLKEESLKLLKGWNLISIPIDEEVELSTFDYEEIWSYEGSIKTYWQKPSKLSSKKAYWIKVDSDKQVNFNGYSYKPNLDNLYSGWNLVGTGEDLIDIKEHYGLKSLLKYESGEWIENPTLIYSGEGFWVNKN